MFLKLFLALQIFKELPGFQDKKNLYPLQKICPLKKRRHREGTFVCDVVTDGVVLCGKKFTTNSLLAKHTRTYHDDDKPFVCDYMVDGNPCGYQCKVQYSLQKHVELHTKNIEKGLGPYVGPDQKKSVLKCDQIVDGVPCDKSFTKSTTLEIHIREHTGEKPVVCEKLVDDKPCGKRYISEQRLHIHIKQVSV